MKKIVSFFILIILSVIAFGQITITLPTVTAAPGDHVFIPVNIYDPGGSAMTISAIDTHIQFDNSKLTYVTTSSYYSGTTGWFASGNYDPTCNSVTVSNNWFLYPSSQSFANGAQLYIIEFIYLQGNCPLTFCVTDFADASGNPVSVTTTNGAVNSNVVTPALSGPATPCQGVAEYVYTTDVSQSNYVWNVTGGTITSGGTSTSSTATVTWTSPGAQSISVAYTGSTTTNFPVTVIAMPTPAISGNPVICAGGSSALNAGSGYSSYAWSTGATTQTITAVSAGTYIVTVTNGSGCPGTAQLVVTQSTPVVASSTAGTIPCSGGTASVTVSAAGGTAPYSGTGAFTKSAGSYTFTVTDANGCTGTTSVTITEPPMFAMTSTIASTNGAEISAFDSASKRVFTVAGPAVEYYTLSNTGVLSGPNNMPFGFTPPAGTNAVPNSVDIRNGVVAVAYAIVDAANNAQQQGRVAFYDAATAAYISNVTVGYLPDMLAFSPDGTKVLTADEGEPNSYGQPTSFDPEGSVSIIDISGGFASPTVTIAGFTSFNGQLATLKSAGVRIYGPGATVAMDLEPEYLTFSPDGSTAYITLQENNAVAKLNISTATITDIYPLGLKDHNLSGYGLDASDRDVNGTSGGGGKINIQNWPIKGMYEPDGIAQFTVGGTTYYITANEGDSRAYTGFSEEVRVGDGSYVLDPAVFPNAATLKLPANLGRLQLTNATGNTDGDPEFEEIHAFGARSFSIWNSTFAQVFDSKDELEQVTAARNASAFNSDGTSGSFDTRSDNKGPEPEGMAVGTVNGILYAFVGSERTGDLFVYDLSNPLAPVLRQYLNTPGDLGVEGVQFVSASKSPTGKALVITSSEVSKTVTVYEFNIAPVITLTGSATVQVCQNATYTDLGATAVDANANNITGSIITTNLVNTSVPGTYKVTYNVTDACGIAALPVERTVIVNPVLAASVSIAASSNPVCGGANETFTATPVNGGSNPVYQWKKNGSNLFGATSSTYSFAASYQYDNGASFTCVLTSSGCVTGSPATSNPVLLSVTNAVASVAITTSANPVVTGTSVTFTATPTNGGTSPSYQWKVNGNNMGSNSTSFTYTPANGDIVFCMITSNAPCVTASFASNLITMTVTAPPTNPLTLTLPSKMAFPGQKVRFPVTLSGAGSGGTPIMVAELGIPYDPAVLTYDTLVNFYPGTPSGQWIYSGNANAVSANWVEPSGGTVAVPDGTTLFEIQFTYLGGSGTLPFTVSNFADGNGNPLTVNPTGGSISAVVQSAGYLAGDFHQHTTYTDGSYSIGHMMQKNNQFGLAWWANSEHGGAFNRDAAVTGIDLGNLASPIYWDSYTPNPVIGTYNVSGGHQNMWRWQSLRDYSFACVKSARMTYSSKMIFQSYEMNVPGHEHASLGLINNQFVTSPNCNPLAEFEFRFDASDADATGGLAQGWTKSTLANVHAKAVEAVSWLHTNYPSTSYLIAAHPERKSLNNIQGFRDMNNAGPDVCFGFESMPGHQKAADRGEYKIGYNTAGTSTYGGCGIYAAKVGGLWDALLSEGRHWWLFSSSDFHSTDADFYPGEYQKTYSYVTDNTNPASYVDALRSGNVYVVEGDLVDSLNVQVGETPSMPVYASMGQTLTTTGTSVVVRIRVHDPEGSNNNTYSSYTNPTVDHIDLIRGKVGGVISPSSPKYSVDTVTTTAVIARFDATGGVTSPNGITSTAWTDLGSGWKEMTYTYGQLADSVYFRVRGTNLGLGVANETDANGNPLSDGLMAPNNATKAFADLWFYGNPVFVAGPETPALSGPVTACQSVSGNVYTTDAGKSSYVWSVTGGTITSGGTGSDNTATVTWTSAGAQSISVSYTGSVTTTLPVTVNAPVATSVSIAASANPVCGGVTETFTATPVNGGSNPAYQWKKGSTILFGATSSTYSFAASYQYDNGATFTCVMTSSGCVTGSPATSNPILLSVTNAVASVAITASANPVVTGTSVTFTATPTNGGTSPSYQWKVNGNNMGTNSTSFAYTPANGDIVFCMITSNAPCVTASFASNLITMTVTTPAGTPLSVAMPALTAIPGQKVYFPVVLSGAGSSGTPISAAELNIPFDPSVLTYDTLINFYPGIPNQQWVFSGNSNILSANWIHPSGGTVAVPDGTTLFEIEFTYIGGSGTLPFTVYNFADLNGNPLTTNHTDGAVSPAPTKTLNLASVVVEGLYNGNNTMHQAYDDQGAHWPAGVADHVKVELHSSSAYATTVYSVNDVPVSTTGAATLNIPASYSGTYYVTIRHRNSIETTTSSPVSFAGSTVNVSFSQPSMVFGNNLILMIDGGHAIFGGDVNQDGIIDLGDFAPVDNMAASYATGYLPEDVNGDGLVDLSDFAIIDNNASTYTGSITPP